MKYLLNFLLIFSIAILTNVLAGVTSHANMLPKTDRSDGGADKEVDDFEQIKRSSQTNRDKVTSIITVLRRFYGSTGTIYLSDLTDNENASYFCDGVAKGLKIVFGPRYVAMLNHDKPLLKWGSWAYKEDGHIDYRFLETFKFESGSCTYMSVEDLIQVFAFAPSN